MAQSTCQRCGGSFVATKATRKFCGSPCQVANNRAENKVRREATKVPLGPTVCEGCEQTYERTAPKQRFCTLTCGTRIQTRKRLGLYAPPILRPCGYCGSEFSSVDGRSKYCGKECAATAQSLREAFRRYGITMAEFRDMMRRQDGKCAICRQPERSERNRLLTIDHDHVTGHIRGLLCSHCNRAIGLLQDDPRVIAAAAGYVKRTRQMPLFT